MKVRKGFVSNSSSSSFVISPTGSNDNFSRNQIPTPKLHPKRLNVVDAISHMRRQNLNKLKNKVYESQYSDYPYFTFEKGKICKYFESGLSAKYIIEKFVYQFYEEDFYVQEEAR